MNWLQHLNSSILNDKKSAKKKVYNQNPTAVKSHPIFYNIFFN